MRSLCYGYRNRAQPTMDNLSHITFINLSMFSFSTYRWIHGQKIADLATHIFALVSKRRANKRTVLDALTDKKMAL
jgi:hypothetical protein